MRKLSSDHWKWTSCDLEIENLKNGNWVVENEQLEQMTIGTCKLEVGNQKLTKWQNANRKLGK